MRCTNKFLKINRLLCIVCVAAIFITGCGQEVNISNPYPKYSGDYTSGILGDVYFGSNLCVTDDNNFGEDLVAHPSIAEGAGVFNLNKQEVTYNHNIFKKMYPASTTKIVTATLIIKKCNLDDFVSVSKEAANPGDSSSVCGISEGDVITVRDLLYGLMLSSGNDAAIALAEYCSGSVEAFAKEMTQYAYSIGATNSNFVNPHGLPDDNHYTTIYDMYLIMKEAITYQEFVDIISSKSHDAAFTNAQGEIVEKTWNNTCQYLSGAHDMPAGIDVVGGKTGTTNAAGYCLVLYSTNDNNEKIISIVFKTGGRSDLYLMMDEILSAAGK